MQCWVSIYFVFAAFVTIIFASNVEVNNGEGIIIDGDGRSPDLLNPTSIESDAKLETGHSRKRNLLLLMPVPEEDAEIGGDDTDEITRRSPKIKRCKSPLRKVRVSLPMNKDELGKITQGFYNEEEVKKYIQDLGPNVRILPLKTPKNILRSIHGSQTPDEEDDKQFSDNAALLNAVREQLKSGNYNKKTQKRSKKNDVRYVCYCEEERSDPVESRLESSRNNNLKQENPSRRDKVVKNNNPKNLFPHGEARGRPDYLNIPNHRYLPQHHPLHYPSIHNYPHNYPHNYKPGRVGPILQQPRKNSQDLPYQHPFYHSPPGPAMIPEDLDDEEEPVKIKIPFKANKDPSKYFTGMNSPANEEFPDDPVSSNNEGNREENGVVGAPQGNEDMEDEEDDDFGAPPVNEDMEDEEDGVVGAPRVNEDMEDEEDCDVGVPPVNEGMEDEEDCDVGAPQVNEDMEDEENDVVGAAHEEDDDGDGLRTSILFPHELETTTEVPSWTIKNTRPFGETTMNVEECIRLYGKEFCVISGTSPGSVNRNNYPNNYVSHGAPVHYNPDENDDLASTNRQHDNPLLNQHEITSMEDNEGENKGEEVDEDPNGYETSHVAPASVDKKDSTNVPALLNNNSEKDIVGQPNPDLGSHLADTSEVVEDKPSHSSEIKEVTDAYFTSKAYENETNQRNPYLLNSGPSSFDDFYITSPGPAEVDKEVEDDVKVGDPLLPAGNESEVNTDGNEDEVNRENKMPRVKDDEEVDEEDEESMPGKEKDASSQDPNLEHHISGKGEAKETEDKFKNGDGNTEEDGGAIPVEGSRDEVGKEEISENDESPVLGSALPSSDIEDDEDSIKIPISDNTNVAETGTINDDPGDQYVTEGREVDAEDENTENYTPAEDASPVENSSNEVEDRVGNPKEVDPEEVINEEQENEPDHETQNDSSREPSVKSDPNLGSPNHLNSPETDKSTEIDQATKDKLPFCDNTLLQNTIKAVINNFAKSNSLPADQTLNSDTVGSAGQSLLPEIQSIPNLGGVLSVPQIQHTIMQRVKETLSKIAGVSSEAMRNNFATDAIRNSLQHMTAAAPVPKEKLPPMTTMEHQFKNGKWTTNLVTLTPGAAEEEAAEPRTTGGDLTDYISNILRHPNVGLQAARHPAVQNMVVQSVKHNFQPKNDESFDDTMVEGIFGNVVGEMEQGTGNDDCNTDENDGANLGMVHEVEDNNGGSTIKPTTDDENKDNYTTFPEKSTSLGTNVEESQVGNEQTSSTLKEEKEEEDVVGNIKKDGLDEDPQNAGKFEKSRQKAVSLGDKLKDKEIAVPPEITSLLGASKDPILENTSESSDINKESKPSNSVTSTLKKPNEQTLSSIIKSESRNMNPEVTSARQDEDALLGSPLKSSELEQPKSRNQGTLPIRDKNNFSSTHRFLKTHEITTEVQRKVTKRTKYYEHTKEAEDDIGNEDFTTSFNSDENQFTSTEAILGAARPETGSSASSYDASPEGDYAYLGKISQQNGKNNRKDLEGSDLFYIGDGVKLPLEIRRLKDGSFALSLSRKVCEHILNHECPCCVPLNGNVVRSPRKNRNYHKKEVKGSDEVINSHRKQLRTNSRQTKRTSRRQRSSSNEFNEFEESEPFEKVMETISMPVEMFAKKYNLSLNLDTAQTPCNTEPKLFNRIDCKSQSNIDPNSLKNLLSVHDISEAEESKLKYLQNNPIFNRMKFARDKQNSQVNRYQRNVNDTTRRKVEILESMLNWLKGLMLGVNDAISKSR